MKKTSILLALLISITNAAVSIAQSYEYDNLNRLTKVIYEDGSIIKYSYDEYGNITKIIKKTKVNNEQKEGDNDSSQDNDTNNNAKDDDKEKDTNNNSPNNNDKENETKDDDGKTEDNNSKPPDINNQDGNNQNPKDNSSSSSGGGGSTQTPKKSEEIDKNKKQKKEENKKQENKDKKEEINYLEEKIKFKDIKQNTWYSESVNYVVNKKIMIGTSKDEFSPNKHTTRAMITTILYRISGDEKPTYNNIFKDIKKEAWYTDGIIWASQNNIVKGISKDEFKPNDTLTRQQLVTILYNFAKTKTKIEDIKTNLDKYKDKDKISNYAINPMNWAVANEILTGTKIDQLSPQSPVTRAQMAVIIRRFIEKMNY